MPGAGATGTVGPGQDNWTYFSSTVTSDRPHVIADATKAYQGTNYLRVDTGNAGFGNSGTTSRSTFVYQDNYVPGATLAGNVLHIGVAVYCENITGTARATGQTIFGYSGDPGAGITGILGGMRLQSNGVFAVFNGAGTGLGLGGATNDTWYRFDMLFHWDTGVINYFINGINQDAVLDGAAFSRTFTVAAGEGYLETDLVDSRFTSASGNATQGHVHRWDSLTIDYDTVPAPSSAALLGLGGLIAGRRRRS